MATKERYVKACEKIIDRFAFIRRMAELDDDVIDVKSFDSEIDALCEKYYDMYANMSRGEILIKGVMDILANGDGEKLMENLSEALKGE